MFKNRMPVLQIVFSKDAKHGTEPIDNEDAVYVFL